VEVLEDREEPESPIRETAVAREVTEIVEGTEVPEAVASEKLADSHETENQDGDTVGSGNQDGDQVLQVLQNNDHSSDDDGELKGNTNFNAGEESDQNEEFDHNDRDFTFNDNEESESHVNLFESGKFTSDLLSRTSKKKKARSYSDV
jgi:hypothetical protein